MAQAQRYVQPGCTAWACCCIDFHASSILSGLQLYPVQVLLERRTVRTWRCLWAMLSISAYMLNLNRASQMPPERGPYGADMAPLMTLPSTFATVDVPLDYGFRPFFGGDPDDFKLGALLPHGEQRGMKRREVSACTCPAVPTGPAPMMPAPGRSDSIMCVMMLSVHPVPNETGNMALNYITEFGLHLSLSHRDATSTYTPTAPSPALPCRKFVTHLLATDLMPRTSAGMHSLHRPSQSMYSGNFSVMAKCSTLEQHVTWENGRQHSTAARRAAWTCGCFNSIEACLGWAGAGQGRGTGRQAPHVVNFYSLDMPPAVSEGPSGSRQRPLWCLHALVAGTQAPGRPLTAFLCAGELLCYQTRFLSAWPSHPVLHVTLPAGLATGVSCIAPKSARGGCRHGAVRRSAAGRASEAAEGCTMSNTKALASSHPRSSFPAPPLRQARPSLR